MIIANTSPRAGLREAPSRARVLHDVRVGNGLSRQACLGAVCPRAGARVRETPDVVPDVLTFADVRDGAKAALNVTVTLSAFGPYFKLLCHYGGQPGKGVAPVLLGETEGFIVAPLRILHVDSMRIYNSKMKRLERDGNVTGQLGMMGLGRVLAKAVLAYGYQSGCTKAEILAINDDDETHRKLVLYYKRLGFKAVREVTGGIADLPHMLVWGGVGTRMDADVEAFLKILRRRS